MRPSGQEAAHLRVAAAGPDGDLHPRPARRATGRPLSRWYLDTAAALKLVVEEPESDALARAIDREQADLVSSWLLETELRRAAQREEALNQGIITGLLDGIGLYEVPASLFREAGLLPGAGLRSLDALHLAAAVRIGVDHVVTYDARMTDSARELGLGVLAPA